MAVTSAQIDTMIANCMAAFYDESSQSVAHMPRIAPCSGDSTTWGLRRDNLTMGPWWMMADMLRLMVERCRVFPNDTQMINRIKQQAAFLVSQFSESQLQGDGGHKADGSQDGTIYASDDAGWKMQSYCDLHRITKDPAWLIRAKIAMPKILITFADPYHPSNDAGDGIKWSPYGLRYSRPDDNSAPGNVSSSIETGMVQAALYIYEKTGTLGFLNYAKGMAARWLASSTPAQGATTGFQDTVENPGAFFVELILDQSPVIPWIRFVPPTDPDGKNHPFRNGGSPHMIQASMGVGVVCAKLYRLTKDNSWLAAVKQIMTALSSTSIYLVTSGKFLNDRDPFSAGFFACDFVREALSLRSEGVDPGDVVRSGFVNTAQYILTNPVAGTAPDQNIYYSADWGVPTDYRNGYGSGDPKSPAKSHSWTENGTLNPGDQAVPQQIMTTAMSGMMAMAGYLCGTLTGATLTDGGSTLTDNGQTLIDA